MQKRMKQPWLPRATAHQEKLILAQQSLGSSACSSWNEAARSEGEAQCAFYEEPELCPHELSSLGPLVAPGQVAIYYVLYDICHR